MPQPLTGPLVGQHILVTRPAGQAASLIAGIEQLGGRATHIPFLAINPVADLSALEQIASRLTRYQACLFISANAVQMAWPLLTHQAPWPETLTAAVVGPGTAQVLRGLGVSRVVLPEARYDSEGLLALPFFAPDQCLGKAFALIRGEGGRDLIARTLQERGAQVDEATTYERSFHPDAVAAMQQLMHQSLPSAMVVTSSESLQRFQLAAPADLVRAIQQVPIIAPHERIAQVARASGFHQVVISAGGDDGILKFLQTYNGSSSTDEPGMKAQ
jgi:uroporphyrinogen-III synthase